MVGCLINHVIIYLYLFIVPQIKSTGKNVEHTSCAHRRNSQSFYKAYVWVQL